MTTTPSLGTIKKFGQIAGQVGYSVEVSYPGETPRFVSFIGSCYGGPVVMCSGATQVFVDDPSRFGSFSPDWVRRFFA